MIAVVALAALVTLTSTASPPGQLTRGAATVGAPGAKSYLHMRADLNQVRLDRLTAAVDRAESDFGSYTDQHDDHAVDHLEERVTKLTGGVCPKKSYHQFDCGASLVPECVHTQLVCDGSPDCHNGHDEDSNVCVNPITEGSAWSWDADWGTCVTSESHKGMLLVTSASRSTAFPSRVKLDLMVTSDDVEDGVTKRSGVALSTTGLWSFGARFFVIFPGTPGFPTAVCHFPEHDTDHCEGFLAGVATRERCGTIHMTRLN